MKRISTLICTIIFTIFICSTTANAIGPVIGEYGEISISPGSTWTNTNFSVNLPVAGKWKIVYNAQGWRINGSRGDQSVVRLYIDSTTKSLYRSIPGVYSSTSQSGGSISLTWIVETNDEETVTLQVVDYGGCAITLYSQSIICDYLDFP